MKIDNSNEDKKKTSLRINKEMLKGHVFFNFIRGRRGFDSNYGTWIYNYLCNQCLSPLTL
jgi:hypothetical protein